MCHVAPDRPQRVLHLVGGLCSLTLKDSNPSLRDSRADPIQPLPCRSFRLLKVPWSTCCHPALPAFEDFLQSLGHFPCPCIVAQHAHEDETPWWRPMLLRFQLTCQSAKPFPYPSSPVPSGQRLPQGWKSRWQPVKSFALLLYCFYPAFTASRHFKASPFSRSKLFVNLDIEQIHSCSGLPAWQPVARLTALQRRGSLGYNCYNCAGCMVRSVCAIFTSLSKTSQTHGPRRITLNYVPPRSWCWCPKTLLAD